MSLARRFGSLREREAAPAPVRTLAMMGLAAGLSALFAATFPASPAAPVDLLRLAGILSLLGAGVIWWLGARMPYWSLHASVTVGTLGTSVVVSQSATGLGMVVTACAYLWISVYAAFFFSRGEARAQMALIAAGFGAALLISDNRVPVDAWFFMTASLLIAGETIGRQSELLHREAQTDSLTGLLNRKGLKAAALQAFSLADRTGIPLTAALVDLDGFKQINDREGHLAGDRLLVDLSHAWKAELAPSDIFARLGGDEFLLILVGSSGEESARTLERLRFLSPAPWSAGVVARQHDEDLGTCLARADSALYEAKRGRRVPRDWAHPSAAPGVAHGPTHS
jgi:diguanylate cyclase (GGDEF)-like protein